MKSIGKGIAALAAASLVIAVGTSALAQSRGVGDYQGTTPAQFRDPNDRIARLATVDRMMAKKNDNAAAYAWGGGGFGGSGGSAQSFANYTSVTNNVTCSTGAGSVGSPLSCTGGSNTVTSDQTTSGSTVSSDTTITGNTTTNTGNRVVNKSN